MFDPRWFNLFQHVPFLYLDLVEVLSCLKRHHIVGGDAYNRFICGVFGSVESQRRLTWNHLNENNKSCHSFLVSH